MLEQFSKSPSLLSVTDYEEHIWLLQLQQPEQVNRRFNLWKLNQGLDIQLLIKAIQDIIKTTPDLNVLKKSLFLGAFLFIAVFWLVLIA
ncbi:hypothetical protein ACFMJ4_18325, partial [Acinetobacter baumannii]